MLERLTLRASALATALLLAGCSLAPTYERPQAPVPAQWRDHVDAQASPVLLDWQVFVTDAALRELVDTALANNRDLRQSILNVEAARAMYRVQRADRLPGVQAQGEGTRQRLPEDVRTPGSPAVQSQYQAGVGLAAFELDLFGRVRNLSEAALQEYLATEEAARAARISLVSEVIQAYLTQRGAQQRLLLAGQTLDARQAALDLISQRRALGAAADLDYQEAVGLVQQVTVERERVEREVRQSGNALALLVGVTDIQPLLAIAPQEDALLVQELSPGLPSDLLARRPDILAAEHRLQARHASIGAARAAFFPQISLTGLFGSASADLSDLFGAGQRAWSFAPRITLPVFDGGRNRANLDLAEVRRDMAVAAYEDTIQQAFREVSDALAATDTLRREEAAQQALAESSAATLRLAQARYASGVDDHLRYLDAQRGDFSARMALVQVRTQRQVALATLFRALGGGWQAPPAAL